MHEVVFVWIFVCLLNGYHMIKCLFTVRGQLKWAHILSAPLPFWLLPTDSVLYIHLLIFSHLGGCPLSRHLHIGSHPSPLPRVWCPHIVPALGLEGRSDCNWKGPWLALCARPLPCQLIGTVSGQNTAALPLIDGHWCQESFFLTRELQSQFTASASMGGLCIYICIHPQLF